MVVIPRSFNLQSPTPEGTNGLEWKTKYGAVGIDAVEKNYLIDGMNEKGLCVNLFYHEGFTEYPIYNAAKAASTLDILAVCPYLLTTCATTEARETSDGKETMYEMFRILDNFNLSVGASAEGSGESNPKGMRSSTIWTTVYDTKNLVLYYHTMNNRRVRQIDLNKLDFEATNIFRIPLDREKSQDIYDVTPQR